MEIGEIKLGMPVVYWSVRTAAGIKENPKVTEVTSEPWKLENGRCLVKVKDIIGGVCITHLDPLYFSDNNPKT